MVTRVPVKPDMLHWACERAGLDIDGIGRRFPALPQWLDGTRHPTLKQLEEFAKATRTPFGYFLLPAPPREEVPIPDSRTGHGHGVRRPSPDLLDTLYTCQQRQEWYREYARIAGEDPFPFGGSARLTDDIATVAGSMRRALAFDLEARRRIPTWQDALRRFIEQSEDIGVLVMVSGVVGSNNYRRLDPEEFRGFALSDPLAPLVFVNGADTRAAQMFTLAHELAHLWLGETALTDVGLRSTPTGAVEDWCNQVAAELLAPLTVVMQRLRENEPLREAMDRLAREFKVSTLVVLRRLHDAGALTRRRFREEYNGEVERLARMPRSSGGDFYLTTAARVSRRFARAVVISAMEGRSSFTEAAHLLGFGKMSTFHDLGRSLGVLA